MTIWHALCNGMACCECGGGLTFALIALYLAIAATGQNLTVSAILFVLALTYLCDGIGVMIGGQNVLMYIGGYAGMVTRHCWRSTCRGPSSSTAR